jgi:hypothetical protein
MDIELNVVSVSDIFNVVLERNRTDFAYVDGEEERPQDRALRDTFIYEE